MSQITFELIPNNLRVPGAYGEINNDFAIQGAVKQPYNILLFGQMLAAGTATALQPITLTDETQANAEFGQGSQLARMAAAYLDNDKFTKLTFIPQVDDGAAAAATGTITLSGTATETGTLYTYIAGIRIKTAVTSGDASAAVATALAAAINAEAESPVTAAAATSVVTLTARNKGEVANELDVRHNYYSGEKTPTGITSVIVAMSGGTGNPNVADVITAMGDEWYNVLVCPYVDAANLAALETELVDRFGPTRAIDGVAFAATNRNHAGLLTLGDSKNSPHVSVMESYNYPRATYERAAMVAAQVAFSAQNDPARPVQTLALSGDMPQAETDRFTLTERNLLLLDGISTGKTDAGGVVRIERVITTYQENTFGAPDTSYLDIETMFTLSYLRFSWRARITQKFPRFKLGNDGARPVQTLALSGDMPQAETDRFTLTERNLLLLDGISTGKTDAGGVVRIERVITTYQENTFGAPDTSYLDIETMFTLSYLRFSWRARITQKFPRFKLGNDGARGDNVMTPKRMKAEMVALAGDWADLGLIESVETFKANLVVSRDGTDVNRLNMILPPDLMNQLRIFAGRIDYRL